MMPAIGLGIDQATALTDPWWYNPDQGQLLQTPGEHHAKAFLAKPELVGFTRDEVFGGKMPDGRRDQPEGFYSIFPNLMLSAGWCRLDHITVDLIETIIIVAPRIDLADRSLRVASNLFGQTAERLVVVIAPSTACYIREMQRIELRGHDVVEAFQVGVCRWARPELRAIIPKPKMRGWTPSISDDDDDYLDKLASSAGAGKSKMRCPFSGRL